MGKRRVRERAERALRVAKSGEAGVSKRAAGEQLSRGQARRAAVRARADAKRAWIEAELERTGGRGSKKAKKVEKAPGLSLSGLGAALDATTTEMPETKGKPTLSAKARRRLVAGEAAQANAVRAHPAFVSDPAEALRQHLLNTVCAAPAKVPPKPADSTAAKASTAPKMSAAERAPKKIVLDPAQDGLKAMRERAKESVRKKRERKAEMLEVAQRVQRRERGRGIGKKSASPRVRGRIGEKRAKILDD